ncbi:MAG TPA: fumarylacetoacetate hydrolase family protein [Egibacteraceae bacterium]|nr:fumarylacetoacetate hydrolase family protein [Egibacteraceae bacterium]
MRVARWRDGTGTEWVGTLEEARLQPVERVEGARQGDAAVVALASAGARPGLAGPPVDPGGVRLLAPVRQPPSVRDFSAFEQHVATARAARGEAVPAEWYDLPVFYFSNPHAVHGPDEEVLRPQTTKLDYELEVAAVIGRDGRDLDEAGALAAIAGYTIFNDLSARDVQAREMRVGLGPAKGKDFASVLGPVLVTPDELDGSRLRPRAAMIARVNGVEWSRGELADLHHTFADMIVHASRDAVVRAGDVIGSGTVGTGCILELAAAHGAERYPWLAPGDVVELEVAGIGVLRTPIAG